MKSKWTKVVTSHYFIIKIHLNLITTTLQSYNYELGLNPTEPKDFAYALKDKATKHVWLYAGKNALHNLLRYGDGSFNPPGFPQKLSMESMSS